MSARILCIEDCIETFQLVRRALGSSYLLEMARSAREASELLAKNNYDLILMDVQLPDGDGFKLCSMLQSSGNFDSIPIVFLTAKNTISDKVLGFQLGADDFITKPFDQLELKARVDSKVRRLERDKRENDIVRVGDLEINKSSQKALVTADGNTNELDLTPLEFKLLLLLATKPNHVFSRDEILNTVWGESIHVYSRSVDTHISKLRKKLDAYSGLIESVHGTGYRIGSVDRDHRSDFKSGLHLTPSSL